MFGIYPTIVVLEFYLLYLCMIMNLFNDAKVMRHAFLILAHNEFQILKILLSMLDDGRNDICLLYTSASFYYMNNRGFNKALRRIEQSEDLREEMGEKGVFYVKSNYDWTLIMGRLKQALKSI